MVSPTGQPGDEPDEATNEDIELVWLAVQLGYFDVPRRTSIARIAREFDISDVEASKRLRRGLRHVLENSEYFRERTQTRGGAATTMTLFLD